MTPQTAHPDTAAPGRVLCVCRDPGTRSVLDACVAGGRVYHSAAEALLAAAREPPTAVVLALDGAARSARQVVDAFRRSHPGAAVYGVVQAAEEPMARSLCGDAGLTDYLVLPRDARRLPAVLAGKTAPVEPASPVRAESATAPDATPAAAASRRLFDASCRLADLAMAAPAVLFREGTRILLKAFGAERGCAFRWSEADERLDLALTVGGNEALGAVNPEPVRSAAERCLRTGEHLHLPPGTGEAPPDGLTCVPVRDEASAIGVICLSPPRKAAPAPADPSAAEALARILARLYRAAVRREEYARLAHRDVETGLLKANPFLAYVDSRIAEARDHDAGLALVLLEPEASVAARTADSPARLGLAVRGALAHGWEGGRIETARYAVTLPAAGGAGAEDAGDDAARRLAGAAPRAHPDLSLRTAVARFPHDGATAKALLSAAEARLAAAPAERR